jgi:CRP-like cAMP-binding protein
MTAAPAKTFLIQIQNEALASQIEQMIMMLISEVEVFSGKMPTSEPPRVLITDAGDFSKWLSDSTLGSTAIVGLTKPTNEDAILDDIVSHKVQIAAGALQEESRMLEIFNRALKFSFDFGKADFRVRNLAAGAPLFVAGDQAAHVYLLKKGKLRIFIPTPAGERDLGVAQPGDFVGEMAYFNQEPRSASVSASEACELIEIPIHNFEAVLMQKPLWCKKILQMMAKRIKEINKTRSPAV